MDLDVVDEQPGTIVAFKFKRPLTGIGYVDKPALKRKRDKKEMVIL